MMSSPAGSSVFALISLLIIAIGVLLLLRRFLPLRSTPAYILLPIFLALALPISIILLVPIDLASSLKAQGEAPTGISLPNSAILISWRVTYWLTFSLTWSGSQPGRLHGRMLWLTANSGSSFLYSGNIWILAIEHQKVASSILLNLMDNISSLFWFVGPSVSHTSSIRMGLRKHR